MTRPTKIVFLGASSASFGMSMFRDLFSSRDLAGSTLTLVGRNVAPRGRAAPGAQLRHQKTSAR